MWEGDDVLLFFVYNALQLCKFFFLLGWEFLGTTVTLLKIGIFCVENHVFEPYAIQRGYNHDKICEKINFPTVYTNRLLYTLHSRK